MPVLTPAPINDLDRYPAASPCLIESLEGRVMLTTWNLQSTASTANTTNGVTVDYAEFALAHSNGNPWSDWGKGLVHSNGKLYAAIGDHLGLNGNAWIYEYDPSTKVLKALADVQTALPIQPTDYGYGKVHGRLSEGTDGNIYFATYWGTTNNDANYVGDHVLQYNPTTNAISDMGMPEPGYGYPSTNMWSNGKIFYAEAFNKLTDPNYEIHFLAYDLTTHTVKYFGGHTGSTYGRSFFVDANGNAYFNNGSGHLDKYDPNTNAVTELAAVMPGSNIRQITRPDSQGRMYATLQDTSNLFRFDPANGSFTTLTNVGADTPAMELDPTGRYIYYMPGGHNAWGTSNDPLIQYDIQTNTKRTITTLSDYASATYANYLGGSYNLTISPDGKVVYIVFNADKNAATKTGFGNPTLMAIHIPADGQTVFPAGFNFTDATAAAGIAPLTSGQYFHSSAWGDANGDGRPDLFVGAFNDANGTMGPNRLMINNGNGTFRQSVQASLNISNARSAGAAFADLDNDGDQDLILVTNYRSTVPSLNHLYRNDGNDGNGNPIYTDVTAGSNLNIASFSGRTPFVLDYDNDGKLDVFLQEDIFGGNKSSHLMRNLGNMVFQDVTAAAGLPTDINGLGGAVGDVNGDGFVDLIIAQTILKSSPNTNLPDNRLYLNNGNGTFKAASAATLAVLNSSAWKMKAGNDDWTAGAALGDLNNDGRMDLVVGAHNESALKHLDSGAWPNLIRVYLNTGNDASGSPQFTDVTASTGIVGIYAKQPDLHLEDVDNDGYLDIETSAVLGLNGDSSNLQPVIYRNQLGDTGTLGFALNPGLDPATWVNWQSPLLPGPVNPRYYPGGGMADYDGDGKLDFFGQEALETTKYTSPLMRNTSPNSNHWIGVQIDRGVGAGNRFGIGSVVEIYKAGQSGVASALLGKKTISLSDGFSTGSLANAHFGLGLGNSVDVLVRLPGGAILTRNGVSANQTVTVTDTVQPPTDQPPTLTTISTFTGGTEDTPYTFTYEALAAAANEADADGDPITFRVEAVLNGTMTRNGVTVVPGVTALSPGESFLWTPSANINGTRVAFMVTAYDGELTSSTPVNVNVTLAAVNDAPTLTTITTLAGGTEDTAYTITYAALAAAANEADPDGDALSFRVESVVTGTLTKNGVAVVPGTTLLSSGESLVWTPAANASGTLSAFSVKAWDGVLASATAITVKVTTAAVNDAPTLTAITTLGTATAGSAFSITYTALAAAANEGDVDSSGLSFRVEAVFSGTLTKNGVAVVPGTTLLASGETLVWTSSAAAAGTTPAFSVKAWDGTLASATAVTVNVTVSGVNVAPTLTAINTLTGASEDAAFTITYAALAAAANEADVNGNPISFRVESVLSGTLTKGGVAVVPGTTLLSSGESWVWTPVANANGTIGAFTVKAYDGSLASATAVNVNVSVAAVNDAPTLTAISTIGTATAGQAYTISYATLAGAANEADVDGNPLSFRIESVLAGTLTKNGAAVVPGTTLLSSGESLVWTPASNASGTVGAFTVKAYDGALASASAVTVNVTVQQPVQTVVYLSDLTPSSWSNGLGPYEKDKSNGGQAAGDGKTITLNGVTYAKGLGTYANSSITYNLSGQYATFLANIGVDDEVGSAGSVIFRVWADGVKIYDSGSMTGSSTTKSLNLSVAGRNQLRLEVNKNGNNKSDSADWAGARLTPAAGAVVLGQAAPSASPSTFSTAQPISATLSGSTSNDPASQNLFASLATLASL